jgi:hypothetical protein
MGRGRSGDSPPRELEELPDAAEPSGDRAEALASEPRSHRPETEPL